MELVCLRQSQDPGVLGSVDGLLVGGLGPDLPGCGTVMALGLVSTQQDGPGLLPTQRGVKLDPGISGCKAQGPYVSPLVGRTEAQQVPEPVPGHW